EPVADLLESAEVSRVAGEVEALGLAGHHPAAPEAAVAIRERPAGEVLRRNTRQRHLALDALIPPVELVDVGDAEVREPALEAERDEELRTMLGGQPLDRRDVQMVVVVVRDEHDVNWR